MSNSIIKTMNFKKILYFILSGLLLIWFSVNLSLLSDIELFKVFWYGTTNEVVNLHRIYSLSNWIAILGFAGEVFFLILLSVLLIKGKEKFINYISVVLGVLVLNYVINKFQLKDHLFNFIDNLISNQLIVYSLKTLLFGSFGVYFFYLARKK